MARTRAASIVLFVAVAMAAAVVSAGPLAARQKSRPVTHQVTIDATSFSPADLAIAAGDTVVWTNKDVIPHTATETKAKGFDSGALAPGATWKRTFKSAGTVDYTCTFHPTMKGRVRVK